MMVDDDDDDGGDDDDDDDDDDYDNDQVLLDPRPMQFDEWWGTPPHHWRMSQA